jgi:hypothetical protein
MPVHRMPSSAFTFAGESEPDGALLGIGTFHVLVIPGDWFRRIIVTGRGLASPEKRRSLRQV